MRLVRPYIPISIRIKVALEQVKAIAEPPVRFGQSDRAYLTHLLWCLFGDEPYHLDHNPALVNRRFNKRTGRYTPDANDPAALIYRTKADHEIKTRVRGDGAKRSDLSEVRYRKNVAKNRSGKKRKHRWASRPLRSRSTFERRA